MGETPLIQSMRSAVEAAPDDVPLRTHLARLLLESGEREEAVRQAAAVLERDPASTDARDVLLRATAPAAGEFPLERPVDVPTELIYATDDEFFEPDYERFIAHELLGILGQLNATNNWFRIGREVIFGEPPVTELGRQEARATA